MESQVEIKMAPLGKGISFIENKNNQFKIIAYEEDGKSRLLLKIGN